MSDTAVADTRRLNSKPQDLTDAYGPPSNFLEIDIFNPQTVGVGRARFTTYEVRMRDISRLPRSGFFQCALQEDFIL
ncbi:sorting nexin-12 isoform X2 [Tupaia chinensis]|uniref:sorting nexin-12 isoform X2 n=1 Tax=Tupaia chinensis TaxID=246437 RepID=UPI000FFB1550|nr:sorting nexin-12 isoform X2 [Tupaia chinensis]